MSRICIHKTLSDLGGFLNDSRKTFVIIDSNLKHLYNHFNGCNIIEICTCEQRKNLDTVASIAEKLLESGADRGAFILGVGGGITTDIAGFTASIYKRGVDFAFVPTTLLAQSDASIGGKNGVNFESYKNILGTINQPQWVYICAEVLRSLGIKEFRAGIAEVLKTFILFDAEYYSVAVSYFEELENYYSQNGTYLLDGGCCNGGSHKGEFYKEDVLLEIIGKCAQYKSGVVERDEFEKGERRMLNLGHTFAHAIEKVCADSNSYAPIMHGEAVAIGMVLAAKLSAKYFGMSQDFTARLEDDLKKVGLPADLPCSPDGVAIPVNVLVEALKKDKKVKGDSIHFILPKGIGDVEDVLVPLKVVEELSNDLC
jgi:3-dehydroquinate synthase